VLRSLKELKVQLIHQPDEDGLMIADHLERIGCTCELTWPLPEHVSKSADVVLLSIEISHRTNILKLLSSIKNYSSTVIIITSYENSETLQLILDCNAFAVIGKPISAFGFLANLTVARNVWLDREKLKDKFYKLEKEFFASVRVSKAKEILMSQTGINESEAYKKIRKQAMSKRITTVDIASAIINAHELLSPNDSLEKKSD